MRYLNSDGSFAAMCGNASLCTARLFVELGGAPAGSRFSIESEAGVLGAVMGPDQPEVELPPPLSLSVDTGLPLGPHETRMGFAEVGVPHLVLSCDDVNQIDVYGRGRALRTDPHLGPAGANVNFLSPGKDGRWLVRTYERGVESETLACGTGAVAGALLLARWGLSGPAAQLVTRSGKVLRIKD